MPSAARRSDSYPVEEAVLASAKNGVQIEEILNRANSASTLGGLLGYSGCLDSVYDPH